MAWTVSLFDDGAESSIEADGRCVSTYFVTYLVGTDSGTRPTKAAIVAATGITRGSPLAENTNAICHKVRVTNWTTPTRPPFLLFLVRADYATNAPLPDSEDDDPTTRRTIWSIAPTIQSTYITKDRHNNLILNTAGQPFDGGIPVDVRMGTATATRNVDATGYDKDAVLANSGKLNNATYLGGAAGTVQVDISASESYEGGWHFWRETYTFSYNPKGWQPKPVSAGFFQRRTGDSGDPDHNKLDRITNGDVESFVLPNDPVQEPEPLDENGVVVAIDDRPDGCFVIDVDYFETMDFATFGL